MSFRDKLDASNIYECVERLWSHHNATANDLSSAFLAVEIIVYLLDVHEIMQIGRTLHIPLRGNKMAAAFDIVYLMWHVFHIGRIEKHLKSIKIIQRKWLIHRVMKLQGVHTHIPPTNKIDPFTIEPVKYLPRHAQFGYSDAEGHHFVFSGEHLYTHIFVHAYDDNPLTRVKVPASVIARLQKWYIAYQRIRSGLTSSRNDFTIYWTTLGVAFTDVATRLAERHHITLQPQWMVELNDYQVTRIFARFHSMCIPQHNEYMRNPLALPLPYDHQTYTLGYVFAREMMQVICREHPPSFYVCALMVAASDFCKPLQDSLADWVIDAASVV